MHLITLSIGFLDIILLTSLPFLQIPVRIVIPKSSKKKVLKKF